MAVILAHPSNMPKIQDVSVHDTRLPSGIGFGLLVGIGLSTPLWLAILSAVRAFL